MKITEGRLRKLIREEIARLIDEAEINEEELGEAEGGKPTPPQNIKGRAQDAEMVASALEQLQTYVQDKWTPAAKSLGVRTGNKNLVAFADKLATSLQAAPVIRQAV